MKAIFFGRSFHKFSSSANFFIEFLKTKYDLDLSYVDEGDHFPNNYELSSYKAIIVWQNEHIAVYLSQYFDNVINISMWDGISARSNGFFKIISRVKNICFSKALYEKIKATNMVSPKYVKYAIKTDVFDSRTLISEMDQISFWERSPCDISCFDVVKVFAKFFKNFHFHGVHENVKNKLVNLYPEHKFIFTDIDVIDNSIYINNLKKSVIYVAPRLAEGIGMSFLEAIANNILVVGFDESTMNEYLNESCCFRSLEELNLDYIVNNYESLVINQHDNYTKTYSEYLLALDSLFLYIDTPPEQNRYLYENFPKLPMSDVDLSLELINNYASTHYC